MKQTPKNKVKDELEELSLDEENVVRTRSRSSMANDFASESSPDSDLMTIASPMKRGIALIFDLIFLVGLYIVGFYLSKINYSIVQWWMDKYHLEFWFPDPVIVRSVSYLTLFILVFIAVVIPVAFFNTSFGKKMLRLDVRGEFQYSLTVKTAFYREIIFKPISILLLVGLVMPFFTKKKKSLHDVLAKTIVVNN